VTGEDGKIGDDEDGGNAEDRKNTEPYRLAMEEYREVAEVCGNHLNEINQIISFSPLVNCFVFHFSKLR